MAFVSDDQEYSVPLKRIKLDESISETEGNANIEFQSFSTSFKSIKESPETGSFIINSEATNSDSGFNERNSSTPGDSEISEPGFSLLDNSSQSSQKSEERNEENDEDDDDKDEVSSTVSNLSDLSGLSEISGQNWKPNAGPMNWVQKQMQTGANPRLLLEQMLDDKPDIPNSINDLTLWRLIYNIISEPPKRQKLRQINTLSDVIGLLKSSKNIIVLTGAGVSVSCGIPDFRSRDGIYSRLAIDFPNLPDPQAMFDIHYFSQDPRPFFKFAREIYPGLFKPSPCHRFIKMLEKHNKLLRNYSQNIDTLEQVSGIQNVIECHGSFATASCTKCKYKVNADDIRDDIFAQRIPLCPKCSDGQTGEENNYRGQGIMKPDIVFFGEGLPELFHSSMAKDKDECDLLIVIGSSLKVRPVALIPNSIPAHIPQILINREPLQHFDFDVELLGDSDVIINQICHILGEEWNEVCWLPSPLTESRQLLPAYNLKHLNSKTKWNNGVHLIPTTVEMSEADSLHMSVDSADSSLASCTVSKERHSEATKERHMSIDSSTRDSGLGFLADSPASGLEEFSFPYSQSQAQIISQPQPSTSRAEESSSDCAIKVGVSSSDVNKPDSTSKKRRLSIEDEQSTKWRGEENEEGFDELRPTWGRSKESVSSRLPANTYYYMSPSRYIFPGAEVYADDAKFIEHCYSTNGTSTSSSEGSEAEEPSTRLSVEESDPDEEGTSSQPPHTCEEPGEHPTEDPSYWQKMIEWVFQKSS